MTYVPLNPMEVADILELGTDRDGISIARDLLTGKITFRKHELNKLADFKRLTVEDITEADPHLKQYRDPAREARRVIARKALRMGLDAEFAAELTGLPLEKIK